VSPDERWLFHIVERVRWERGDDPYAPDSLAREGFVHCSYRDKVVESARLYFPSDASLVVLEIDPSRLTPAIDIASTPRGPMPHVLGPIDRACVTAVLSLEQVPARGDHKAPSPPSLDALLAKVRAFNAARDWRQFHSPKNLAMALTIESAELAEPFRWDTDERSWTRAQSSEGRAHLQHEMADVLMLLLSLSDYLQVDIDRAVREKLALNEQRYPADQAKGRAEKYTAYAPNASSARAAQSDEGDDD
jgi:uncharacterized protein (DUF952 family)